MKEIEEKILARKDELTAAAAKPEKKPAVKPAGASEGAAEDNSDILANIDEDFEEFTPAEE